MSLTFSGQVILVKTLEF